MTQTSERLHPKRSSPRYYPLRRLCQELSQIAADLESHRISRDDSVLLDFGCGDMPYKPLFAPRVESYLGVDLAQNELADIHIESADVCPKLGDSSADIVLSTQVLEHVDEPKTYLSECHRLLKEGGLLILSTHGYWPYHPSPNDYWRWTSAGLQKTIGESSFQILSFTGIMGLAATSVQLLQDAFVRRIHPRLHPLFFWMAQGFVATCDKVQSPAERSRDACIFLLLARKEPHDHAAG